MITREEIVSELENGIVILGKLQKSHNLPSFLNNFYGHLVGGFNRRTCETLGIMDEKYSDKRVSERARSRTLREFYEEVDQTTRDAGIDEKLILDFQKYYGTGNTALGDSSEEQERIANIMFPIYVALRIKGYAHYPDLTC